jgi:hypothetical protein
VPGATATDTSAMQFPFTSKNNAIFDCRRRKLASPRDVWFRNPTVN